MPAPAWTAVAPLAELEPGSLRTFKSGRHQLVVAATETGEVHALDNRCPHEGYPLAQGDLKGCALTCCWHNWKFDVRNGACIVGGEAVRSYPTRVVDGEVQVDLADPDPRDMFPVWRASLLEGITRHENDRAIRDGVRLVQAGYDPWRLLVDIAVHDARHAEYGTTHALPVAADCGRLLGRYTGVHAMYAIAPAIDMCGESVKLRQERERPAPLAGADERSLRAAIEAEDAPLAEALLLGAFDAGTPRATIEGWIAGAVSDHFLDFGHQLIYLVKGQELLAHADDAAAREVYASLVYRIVYGTREDTLPYMAPYAQRLREMEGELGALATGTSRELDGAAFRAAVLDGRSAEACAALRDALRGGVAPQRIAEELVVAAAERLYRFDPTLDANGDVAENWLWVTHRFTFTAAVRHAVLRWPGPSSLRLLFQALMFLHSGRAMDAPVERRVPRDAAPAETADVLAAIDARDPERAVALGLGYLAAGGCTDELREAIEDTCLADPLVRPIVVAHAIKTSFAAFEELQALAEHPERATVLVAALRFLASPIVERRVHQLVTTSIEWVVDGRVPRKLTQ